MWTRLLAILKASGEKWWFKLRKLNLIILVIISLFMVTLCSCRQPDNDSQDIIVSLGDENVKLDEYEIYLHETIKGFEKIGGNDIWDTDFDGKSAFDTAKDNALNSLVMVKLNEKRAEKSGLKLSEDEVSESKSEAEKYIAEYGSDVPQDIVEGVMYEKAVYSKMRERLLSEYTISMEGFDGYLSESIEYYKKELSRIKYSAILVLESSQASDISRRAKNGEDFAALLNEYHSDNNIISAVSAVRDITAFTVDRSNISAGFVSPPVRGENGFVVYKIEAVTEPGDLEIERAAAADFEKSEKDKLFNDMLQSWKKETKIVINEDLFNSITEYER